ncbi:MAG: Acetamidase [Cirrosporium novae-zelandiae]|nr:MAG: Acetamidase [Cirrosporium novae-zelandiae]
MTNDTATWQGRAKAKREAILQAIPEKWILKEPIPSPEEQRDVTGKFIHQFLNSHEIEITETDAVGIVEKTTSGTWTAVEVIEAFAHRAALAHQLVHCLHEFFVDTAVADAKKLDAYFAMHKRPIGPLHGLPISLKDQFHIKGVETTMGYIGWIGTFQGKKGTGKEMVFESEMVRELRNLGAILYCKTSVPHTLMVGETVNHIVGYTLNPKNRLLSCGGSSGGEGALIGLRGSPLGFGTDIGGSIRIPAAFNGLYGLRPSHGRMPYEGMANSMDGQNTILSVVGPLATTARSLRLAVKSVLSQQPWLYDPLVNELPWRDEMEKQVDLMASKTTGQLSFGILRNDGVVTPHPPVQRAIEVVAKTIEKLGHKVIDWNPPSHKHAMDIGLKTWIYDGGKDVHEAAGLSGEPLAPQLSIYGSKPVAEMVASDIAAVNIEKREYQKEYMDYWNSTAEKTGTGRPVDAYISPLAPFAAVRRNRYSWIGYSIATNVLDYSSCVLPVTHADEKIDVVNEDFKPMTDLDQDIWKDWAFRAERMRLRHLKEGAKYETANVEILETGTALFLG